MTREDILALRPLPGASAADWHTALQAAEVAKRGEMARQNDATARMRANPLDTSDDDLAAARPDYDAATLAVTRLDALIAEIRSTHGKAHGSETLDRLREEHGAADAALDPLRQWQTKTLPKIKTMIAEGFSAHDGAYQAIEGFRQSVVEAYAHPEVRDAGALGVKMPVLTGELPRVVFSGWTMANG